MPGELRQVHSSTLLGKKQRVNIFYRYVRLDFHSCPDDAACWPFWQMAKNKDDHFCSFLASILFPDTTFTAELVNESAFLNVGKQERIKLRERIPSYRPYTHRNPSKVIFGTYQFSCR